MAGVRILSVGRWVGVALVILSILLMLYDQKKERGAYRLLSGRNLLVVSVIFTVLMILLNRDSVRMIKLCYGLLPAIAIYYLIYHSYQPEFFLVTTDAVIGVALLVGIRMAGSTAVGYFAVILAAALAGLQIWYLRKRLSGGKLPAGFGPHAFVVTSVTALLMLLLVVLGAMFGAAKVFYLLCAAAAYLFILAVYYTVKLM